jgi:hypothetical protein
MNTQNLPFSAWLVAIGAGAVLLIGAFARFDPADSLHPAARSSPSPPALTEDDPPAETLDEAALPSNLSPGLSEIIKLAQAHVDESVILAYVKNSGQVFSPTADEILYLSDLGLSQDVIGALVKTGLPAAGPQSPQAIATAPVAAPPPVATPAPTAPPAAESQPDPGPSVFYNDLASYGAWLQQPDYGLCWQPTVETIDPSWRPYVDAGQWMYSDYGWYWQSDYTWGWAVFHYGRWVNVPRRGWLWVPDNVWAPAWVAWRSTPSYIGWAPLPPGASLNVLAQLTYNGEPAGPNATFGLRASAYSFVGPGNLISRHLPRRILPAAQVKSLVENSAVIDSYAIVNNRIFDGGASRDAVAAAAQRAVPEVTLRAVSSPEAAGLAMDRKTLGVYVPAAASTGPSSSAPTLANKPRVQAQAERPPSQEEVMLAENNAAETAVEPVAADNVDVSVQLPPLRYPAQAGPPGIRRHSRDPFMASAPVSTTADRDWSRGYATPAVERPSTPAPRFEGFNPPPAHQAELPRPTMENRPAAIEPARATLAPPAAPSASSGGSKSGK